MVAYESTGANEGQATQHVGRRVEISGKLKAAEVAPSGRPTGGATAGKPPEGIDIAGQDLKLRELEVTSIRQVHRARPAERSASMAERQSAMTPAREERRLGATRPSRWGGSPFRSLQRMADELDRMLDDFGFGQRWTRPLWRDTTADMWTPDIDVFQKNNELTIRADVPGLKREDVTVDITDNEVCIQGERKRESEEEREGYYRTERSYGSFYRVIPLPEGAMTDQAKANFKDGVLEITMPAPPKSVTRGRRVEITPARSVGFLSAAVVNLPHRPS
jgi:HSP20 family protein